MYDNNFYIYYSYISICYAANIKCSKYVKCSVNWINLGKCCIRQPRGGAPRRSGMIRVLQPTGCGIESRKDPRRKKFLLSKRFWSKAAETRRLHHGHGVRVLGISPSWVRKDETFRRRVHGAIQFQQSATFRFRFQYRSYPAPPVIYRLLGGIGHSGNWFRLVKWKKNWHAINPWCHASWLDFDPVQRNRTWEYFWRGYGFLWYKKRRREDDF